jgi:hypothetical protein
MTALVIPLFVVGAYFPAIFGSGHRFAYATACGVYFAVYLMLAYWVSYWPCPRCSQIFSQVRPVGSSANWATYVFWPWTNRCPHCDSVLAKR